VCGQIKKPSAKLRAFKKNYSGFCIKKYGPPISLPIFILHFNFRASFLRAVEIFNSF